MNKSTFRITIISSSPLSKEQYSDLESLFEDVVFKYTYEHKIDFNCLSFID